MTNYSEDHIPKTLREHNVQPGDVVRPEVGDGYSPVWPLKNYTIRSDGSIIDGEGDPWGGVVDDCEYPQYRKFTVLSRASRPEPIDLSNPDRKTWGTMTDAEKVALLLAAHKGKVIEEFSKIGLGWLEHGGDFPLSNYAYRVRPEHKRGTVRLTIRKSNEYNVWFEPIGTIR